jgi:hypothetical protein
VPSPPRKNGGYSSTIYESFNGCACESIVDSWICPNLSVSISLSNNLQLVPIHPPESLEVFHFKGCGTGEGTGVFV